MVVRDLQVTGNTFRLRDYQVVNGAQTSNVLFENKDVLSDERRSKQYDSTSDVIKSRVIDRLTLVRSVAAVVLDEPHLATGYPAQLMSRLADVRRQSDEGAGRVLFFAPEDEPVVYFAAAAAYYRLDVLFRTVRIDPKYKPARWHILAAARHLVLPGPAPALDESKAARAWPKPLLDKVWDEKAVDLFTRAASLVEGTGLEISRPALRNAAATAQILQAVAQASV